MTEKNRGVALPLLLLVAFLLKNLCAFAAEYRFNAVGLAFVRDVRRLVYERLLGQSGAFHAKHPSGDLISRVTGDVDRIQSLFGTDLADLVQSVATIAGLSVLVVSRSPELTLIALVVAPAIVVPVVADREPAPADLEGGPRTDGRPDGRPLGDAPRATASSRPTARSGTRPIASAR